MKSNRSTKEKFKKIILSFWFWVIVAVVSYVIFVLIPIQWTGEGLEIEEGTGSLKTFFAYLTQFAWIIVVVLIIVDIIKWIQKTKIGDHWKISFTILGIVGIVAYVFYALLGMGIFNNFSYEYDERIGDLDNEDKIRIHIQLLEEDGYEVLYFADLGILEGDDVMPYLKMKSLGNRNEQVNSALFSLGTIYPDAPEYTILILEPTQECWYRINGDDRRALYRDSINFSEYEFDEEGKLILTEEILRSNELYEVLQNQIENPSCS